MTWGLTALLLIGAVGRPVELTPLVPRESIERKITGGEEQRFEISLTGGEYASIVVEQRGIDVEASILDAEGNPLTVFQDEVRPNGTERIELVAEATGTYVLVLRSVDGPRTSGACVIRMDSPRPATDADRQLQQARALHTRGREMERTGKYLEAKGLLEQALEVAESVRGHDDPYVAEVTFDLAGNALERLDDGASRAFYDRAIRVFDATGGPSHPYAAIARSRLALLDERAGQPQKAEAGIREILPVLERALGPTHPWYLQSLVTFAGLRQRSGDLEQAEQITRATLAVVEETNRTGTLLHATILNNLGDILRTKKNVTAAESLFRQSMAVGEAVVGGDSLFVATALQNLGILARERKDYPAALASYGRALAIRERILGSDHPSLAGVLTNVGNVHRAMGNPQLALEMHFRALRMWERAMGLYGRETLLVVGNIARTYAGAGDVEHALEFQRRADAILETQMGLYLASGSERQKLAFVRAQAERTDRTISLHLGQARDNPDAASLAALVLLQRKGRVQDAMANLFGAVRRRVANPADRDLMDQLKTTTASLARIALGGPGAGTEDGRETLARLQSHKEQLEATLSTRSSAFRTEIRPVTLEIVQAAIPGDAVLLEFAVFRPFDPKAERNEDAYGPPHYAAYVIPKHGTPSGVDLGAVAEIDPLVVGLRDALRNPSDTQARARGRAVDERILRPLRARLNGATRLLVSPDGGLTLVPFEALVDQRGRYLIERYATTYLTSGRDLLRMQIPRAAPGRPVIIADPLFGEPAAATPLSRALEARRSVTVGSERSTLYFAPLSGSALEGRAIKSLFPDASLLTGRLATKSTLERVSAPRILHIASHGFFLDDDPAVRQGGAITDNPMLRSGLAFAGANLPGVSGSGIMTGLEAAGLNLWGTSLVTLSACDTGVGEVRNGEGVYGLRRAFMLAGSETLVMSLWPVTDAVARDTMVAYYARLRDGFGRGDALRQAKLAIMKRPAFRHPYYWAGFIQSGDWTRLPPVR